VILRVNDRGPFYSDRIIDLSYAAAKKLGYAEIGTARSRSRVSTRSNGGPRGRPAPLMLNEPQVAQNSAPVITASAGTVEQWTPPPQQHAAVVPVQISAKTLLHQRLASICRWARSPTRTLPNS
jgi:rare lipoprotein A